jgi:hypothetical protein
MRSLGFVLTQAVADLAALARCRPEIVREWSREQNVVPVLTGRNVRHRKQLAADLEAFAVGEATPCRVNPPKGKKAPDISTPANAFAGQLCKHLADTRAIFPLLQKPVPPWARLASKLPPLSNDVWERWADAGWACLLDATDKHPEESPSLRPLGAKANHWRHSVGLTDPWRARGGGGQGILLQMARWPVEAPTSNFYG